MRAESFADICYDSNVRDYMGLNRVNQDIAETLGDLASPNFWWLNNGVTILATSAWAVSNKLHMENVQVVNGLQTTESIFRHFSSSRTPGSAQKLGVPTEPRSVMVKVIVTDDVVARDSIIRATNNQTSVEEISLHATDKIQRDIEETLQVSGLFYERRKNFYFNQDAIPSDMVTPMYLASGVLALIHRQPWSAVSLKQKHLRDRSLYDYIFNERLPLKAWAIVARALKASDAVLEASRPTRSSEGFLKKNRYILALLTLARHFGTFDYTPSDLGLLEIDNPFLELTQQTWDLFPSKPDGSWRSRSAATQLCVKLAESCGIEGVKRVLSAESAISSLRAPRRLKPVVSLPLTDEFIASVYSALPPQPWKPGTHKVVLATLGCTLRQLSGAVESLVSTGRLLKQQDGVLYGPDGTVKGWDADRVRISEDGSIVRIVD